MGMPRYVADLYKQYKKRMFSNPHTIGNLVAARVQRDPEILNRCQTKEDENAPTIWFLLASENKKYFREYYHHPTQDKTELLPLRLPDQIEKVPAQLYVGIDDKGQADFRTISICRFFVPTLQKRNADRIAEDRSQVMLRDQVMAAENKVYKSRSFPPSVRAMIFARDGFCCQACGRSRDELIREGSHLQVDHKVAWGDGGQTCYSNGETLCRECNHAKHTTKKFWHAKEALWGRRE